MKVLVYEPGSAGHRPIYRRYIDEAFREAGCETVVVTKSYAGSPWALAAFASGEGVSTVFVCTMDGIFGWLAVLGFCCRLRGIRVGGIYYLFNNLFEGWKRYLWRSLLHIRIIDRIFAPDLRLAKEPPNRGDANISFLADPWDRRLLVPMAQPEAAAKCGISKPRACVFLLFGELSERKGIHLIIEALEKWDFDLRPHVRILAAGRATKEVKQQLDDTMARYPNVRDALVLHNRWIHEQEHSHYFSAASYLCAAYPKNFRVSISTVIRSFAVRRPVVVSNHGMIGKVVSELGAGLVFDVDSRVQMQQTLEAAYDIFMTDPQAYGRIALAGRKLADVSELTAFKRTLIDWINILKVTH